MPLLGPLAQALLLPPWASTGLVTLKEPWSTSFDGNCGTVALDNWSAQVGVPGSGFRRSNTEVTDTQGEPALLAFYYIRGNERCCLRTMRQSSCFYGASCRRSPAHSEFSLTTCSVIQMQHRPNLAAAKPFEPNLAQPRSWSWSEVDSSARSHHVRSCQGAQASGDYVRLFGGRQKTEWSLVAWVCRSGCTWKSQLHLRFSPGSPNPPPFQVA